MKCKLLVIIICVLAMLISGCTISSNATETTPNIETAPKIKLSQAIIDTAVLECQDKTSWGVNLGKVRINYVAGAHVEAAIVLHNGGDAERLVKLSYKPVYSQMLDADTGVYYELSPIQASGWVTIDTTSLRMKTMETVVVPIHLLVPSNQKNLPDRWEFDIRASGTTIKQYQYTIKVTTNVGETSLEVHLPQPLLENKLSAILDIISEADEVPYAINYNPTTGILYIVELKESEVRNITIIYEYGDQLTIDYSQRWLITMLS